MTSDEFFVGCLNRRTDPLLLFKDTLQSNAWLNFYPTAELDLLARFGGNTINGQYHDSTWWRNMYGKSLGTREIVLPFNYKPLDTTEYCLLRLSDLGASTPLDTDSTTWWFSEPFKHRIDTIIGQNRNLVLKLLPGEGRILRVQILHPGKAQGYLAHSSQSKLIEFPVDANGDTIRYHLVYYKPKTGSDKNKVYYRRSLPIRKDAPVENIVWEPEFMLSEKVLKANLQIADSLPCDYPSIVVRKDGDTIKSFIVYSCKSVEYPWDSYIVENVVRYRNDIYMNLSQDTIGKVISGYYGHDRKEWGNPVINASYGGNYYAWSDSIGKGMNLSQIVSAWKAPNSVYFENTNKDSISYPYWSGFAMQLDSFKHPSLNVYSNIDKTEDNCALVFQAHVFYIPVGQQQFPPFPNSWQIFYTRLKRNENGLRHYLTDVFSSNSYRVDTCFRIARLTDFQGIGSYDNTYPVILRNLGNYNFSTRINIPNRKDRVYWQTKSIYPLSGKESLYTRAINLVDTSNSPKRWSVYSPASISRTFRWLQQPNVNNGYAITDGGEVIGQELILNFTASNWGQQPSNMSQIWQFPHYLSSTLTSTDVININPLSQRMYFGQQPHLSMHAKSYNDYLKIWQNRRVYEFDNTTPPKIMSSAKYFYKMVSENEEEGDALIGFTNDSTYYYINLPTKDNANLTMHLPYAAQQDSIFDVFYEQQETDTLYSDWFTVNDEVSLEFKCYGYDTNRVSMKIHQQSTNNYIGLNLPVWTPDTSAVLRQFTLVNGQGFNYRLEFTKRDTTAHYSEKIVLDGLPIPDTLRKISASEGNIIDLQMVSYQDKINNTFLVNAFPNPAEKLLYVSVYLPVSVLKERKIGNLKLTLFNQTGMELIKSKIKPAEVLSLNVENLTIGTYFIRIEEESNQLYIDKLNPAAIPVVIMK